MRRILFVLLVIPFSGIAQNGSVTDMKAGSGIDFEHGLSWNEIKAKAKEEHKYIFVDCYATWCGPCRFMDQNIFSQKSVAGYMNTHFVNVRLQMDKTPGDNEEIRKWYNEAATFSQKYSIHSFPTYLFFLPDGEPVHRITGATGNEPTDFIAKAKEALDTTTQYYTVIESYRVHLDDSAFLRKVLVSALKANDAKNAENLSDAYTDCMSGRYNAESVSLMIHALQSSHDKAFILFLNQSGKMDSILGRIGASGNRVSAIIAKEEVISRFNKGDAVINWSDIVRLIKKKYPAVNEEMISQIYHTYISEIAKKELKEPLYKDTTVLADWNGIYQHIKKVCPGFEPDSIIMAEKPIYYLYRKMQPDFDASAFGYLEKYGDGLNKYTLNSFLWYDVFMHSTNYKLLSLAIQLSRKIVPDLADTVAAKEEQTFEFMDTYANLLYKVGEKEEAIAWEKAALDATSDLDLTTRVSFRITLERMYKGESTWEGRNGPMEEYK